MADDLILAIDQGTSAVKVVFFDLEGRVVVADEHDTPLAHPEPTWIESDAESWWTTVAGSIRMVLRTSNVRAERVRAIGVCGFMHTLVPIDGNGIPLCPPLLWPDQRCAEDARALSEAAEVFVRTNGQPPTTMSSVPRLRWLGRHHPEVLERARTYLLPKDFLRFRLTGERATDARDAGGTGLLDRRNGDWSDELLNLAGVPRSAFPPIRRSDEIAGEVTAAVAAETGLIAGTPVVVGSGDWFSTIVGSGCCLPERVCLYLGTAGIAGAFVSPAERTCLGRTSYFGSVTSTGSALRWVRTLFADPNDPAQLDYARICAEAEDSEPGARGLVFLPHLLGERGGGIRPLARGTLHGLTLAHRRGDVFRAILEGTAFWLQATTEPRLSATEVGDLLLLGGGARSPLWRRIVGALYQRRLLVPEVIEGGALGVAKLAAVGTGLAKDYDELAAWTRISQLEEPDSVLVERYAALAPRFHRVEAALRSVEEL